MEFHAASASRGLAWFQGAVRMLDRNPRGLLAVTLLLVLIDQLPNLLVAIPDVAVFLSVLLLLLGPTLLGGLFHAIAEADAGRTVSPSQLFEGFRRRGVRGQLLLLGVLVLLALLLMGVAAQRILGPDNIALLMKIAAQKVKPDSAEAQRMAGPLLQTMMAILLILFVLMSGLFFAIPRVMFDGRGAMPAFIESIAACAVNVLALTVYGLLLFAAMIAVAIALSVVAVVLDLLGTFGAALLGLVMVAVTVVVMLVSASGNYLAWREVFGHGNANMPPSQTGIIV